MKATLKRLFPSLVSYRNRLYNYFAHYRFKGKPAEEVFETIYKENHWQDAESKSGTGSNIINTEEVIGLVNQVIQLLKVKSMMDIPCGDFNWMKEVNLQGVKYIGADIVSELVINSRNQYSTKGISFQKLNILESSLPAVDLIFTRDCLVHFSYTDIQRTIASIKASRSSYWITTTFPEHTNYDIITGDWRPINLQAEPFNFPEPLYLFNEKCFEDDRYRDKSLAVWEISAI